MKNEQNGADRVTKTNRKVFIKRLGSYCKRIFDMVTKNKILQVSLIVGLILIFLVLVDKMPNSDNWFGILRFIMWIVIVLGTLSLVPLLLSELEKDANRAKNFESAYYGLLRFAAHIVVAILIIVFSITISGYLASFLFNNILPFLNNLKIQNVQIILFFLVAGGIFYLLNKKVGGLFRYG